MLGLDDEAAEALTEAFFLEVKGRINNIGRALVLDIMSFVTKQLQDQTETIVDELVGEPMGVLQKGFDDGSVETVRIAKEEFSKAEDRNKREGKSGFTALSKAALGAVDPIMSRSQPWVSNVTTAVKASLKNFPSVLKQQMLVITTSTKTYLNKDLYPSFKTMMEQLVCDMQSFLLEKCAAWATSHLSGILAAVDAGSNGVGSLGSVLTGTPLVWVLGFFGGQVGVRFFWRPKLQRIQES